MPETHVFSNWNWSTTNEFIATLSPKSRNHLRKNVVDFAHLYDETFVNGTDGNYDADRYYHLYKAVKDKSLTINTFDLPLKFFENAAKHPNWEFFDLHINHDKNERRLASFGVCYKSDSNYTPMVIGIDYEVNAQFQCYRQNMFRVIKRGKALGIKNLYFGMDASFEKTRLGARATKKSVYLQVRENFNMNIISLIKNQEETYAEKSKGV